MSHAAPPSAKSRRSPSDSTNTPSKSKSQAHPLPANPMHHQGFIKQQVKSAQQAQYAHNAYASHRYQHGSAATHLTPLTQTYSTTSGPSTSGSATSGSSSMYSALSSSSTQPSPATSSTSSISSLRTPPDFLMHGATLSSKIDRPPKVYMSLEEIDARLKLLDTLTSDLTPDLPPVPGSLLSEDKESLKKSETSQHRASTLSPSKAGKADAEKGTVSATKSRKRPSDSNDELPSFRKKTKAEPSDAANDAKQRESSTASTIQSSQQASQSSPSQPAGALPKREWSKEVFASTSAAYLDIARSLKHSADRRVAERNSNNMPRDSELQLMANFESTEAILCFVYAFWCQDQASATPRSCIASNWLTLLGLLHYARARHDKSGHVALAGLCRFIEALVLQHLANSEKKHVQQQLSDMATAESEGEESSLSLPQLSASLSKALVDEETSRHLLAQARGMLSQDVLSKDFPEVWAASVLGRSTLKPRDVDPASVEPEGHPESDAVQGEWSWPMDSTVSFPHAVCFGRALLREGARRLSLPYLICSPP